jgi:hypothetical protein
VGRDQGEGDITDRNSILFTLTPTLSYQGRGSFRTCENIKKIAGALKPFSF